MEGNQDYDPFLGDVTEHQARRACSGAAAPHSETDNDSRPNAESEPSAEALRTLGHAIGLRETGAAAWLYMVGATSLSDDMSPEAFKLFRDTLLEDAGNPTDRIEIMLIEQLALAHFTVGRLQLKSCGVADARLAIAYSDAATRLLGEFRRCSLALEDYRAKQAARKERSAGNDVAEETAPATPKGKPRPSTNGKHSHNGGKKGPTTELGLEPETEMPAWLKKRMASLPPNGQHFAAIEGNGKG